MSYFAIMLSVLFVIVGCQQVQKPEVKGEGPLAVKWPGASPAPNSMHP